MRRFRILAVLVLTATALALTPMAFAAVGGFRCNGSLPAGNYAKVTVPNSRVCFAEPGVHIAKGLEVRSGATFVLGDESDPQPPGTSTIAGGVTSDHAANVQIHFADITGDINLVGGSGPFFDHSPFCFPECITWNTLEDNRINGNVLITDYNGFWQGFFRNDVAGSISYRFNVLQDPDGNEIQTNTIHGDLACDHNSPKPQAGDSGGSPNVVYGRASGQCKAIATPPV